MDPPSDLNITHEYYSSPITSSNSNNSTGYNARVADLPIPSKKTNNKKKSKKGDDPDEILFWSPAKKSAWEARNINPNAFYYRHCDPGVTKRTGAWDEDEKKMFMKAIKVHPPNQGKWGLFARQIPGRVGYQCRNFYHRLLESGELRVEDLPGEQVTIKKRVRKNNKQKIQLKNDDNDSSIDLDSEKVEEEELHEIEEKIPKKKTNKIIEKNEIKIKSLTLICSDLINFEEIQIENPIKAIDFVVETVENTINDVINEEISMIEPPPIEEILEIKQIIEEENKNENIIELPNWSPRMKEPWKRLNNINPNTIISFPHIEEEQTQFEYQCSKILRLNQKCSINLLLLSFPVPEGKRRLYQKAIRNKLAENENSIVFESLLKKYFYIKSQLPNLYENDKKKLLNSFVDNIIQEFE